jgi:SAM-dependent methyltransferase
MQWHERYLRQAAWTRDLRGYLFGRAGLQDAGRVLEAGCGTGAILSDLDTPAALHGLDIDGRALKECRQHAPHVTLTRGDVLRLPYAPGRFDIVYCHFLLLWVPDPLEALREMKRLCRGGGSVLALAEPDYESRLDRPAALEPLGRRQADSLRRQGADPSLGSRLAATFAQAGLQVLEAGRLESRPAAVFSQDEWESEWAVLEADLAGQVPEARLRELRELDREAWTSGERVLDVPTYFAWGRA